MRHNHLTIVELLTPKGQSMIDDDLDALKVAGQSSFETKQVSGSADSVLAQLTAMTTNPAPAADAAMVAAKSDPAGRLLTTPIQVRDLRATALATLNSNAETTLYTGVAGEYGDIIFIKGCNTSDQVITIAIRDAAAGNIVDYLTMPAGTTAGVASATPIPQAETGNNWTVAFTDSDISNTAVYVSALIARVTA